MSTHTPRINRLSQIVRFLSVSRLFLWTIWLMYRERRRVIGAHARGNDGGHPNGDVLVQVLAAFRKTAMKQGVLLIKLGQFLSSRIDLLPERAMSLMLERYYGMTLGEVNKQVMAEMVQDVKHLLYGQPFQIPAQFAFPDGRLPRSLVS